jgi:hypothetical protein
MEEQQAIKFYEEQKARGAGAQRFKHGLGFGGCAAASSCR